MSSNSNSIDSWTFLVSANRYLDYRTVVAPDFLCKIKKSSIIARNAGGDLTSYKINYVYDEKIGNLTLVFRVIEAIAEDLEIERSGTLKDSFGREIYLIEGLCFKGKVENIQLSENDFIIIHNKIKPLFQEFWNWSAGKPSIESSSEKYEGKFIVDIHILRNIVESVSDGVRKVEQEMNEQLPKSEKSSQKKRIRFFSEQLFGNIHSGAFLYSHPYHCKNCLLLIGDKKIKTYSLDKEKLSELNSFECDLRKPEKTIIKADETKITIINIANGYFINPSISNNTVDFNLYEINKDEQYNTEKINIENEYLQNILPQLLEDRLVIIAKRTHEPDYMDKNEKLLFWDFKNEQKSPIDQYIESGNKVLAISPNNKLMALGNSKGKITIYNLTLTAISQKKSFDAHGTPSQSPVNTLAFTKDNKRLVSGGDDCKIKLWNITKEQKKDDILGKHDSPISMIDLDQKGTLLQRIARLCNTVSTVDKVILPIV